MQNRIQLCYKYLFYADLFELDLKALARKSQLFHLKKKNNKNQKKNNCCFC